MLFLVEEDYFLVLNKVHSAYVLNRWKRMVIHIIGFGKFLKVALRNFH